MENTGKRSRGEGEGNDAENHDNDADHAFVGWSCVNVAVAYCCYSSDGEVVGGKVKINIAVLLEASHSDPSVPRSRQFSLQDPHASHHVPDQDEAQD